MEDYICINFLYLLSGGICEMMQLLLWKKLAPKSTFAYTCMTLLMFFVLCDQFLNGLLLIICNSNFDVSRYEGVSVR